jgi:glycosyltransferase involved in cell wall biosynthesis
VLTVSEFSRDGIAEQFRIDPQKIGVVGEAPDAIFHPVKNDYISTDIEALGINQHRRYILYVGGFGPHKNVISLLQAVKELVQDPQFSDLLLVLVGEYQAEVFHSEYHELSLFVNQHLEKNAIFTGYLEDEKLVMLLNGACVLVLPSWLEGYGLPAIEAAACGCPVIATRNSPLPGVLGESALFFDPSDVPQLVAHLKTVLISPEVRQKMQQEGLKAVRNLSWESAAQQLYNVISSVSEFEPST